MLYITQKAVVIRDLADMSKFEVQMHPQLVTCAKFSPNGYSICSGDCKGNLYIWDASNQHNEKAFHANVLNGPIKDIAWSADSQRIAVVGEGKKIFAKIILWETNNQLGDITVGSGKTVNTVDIRPTLPLRLALSGEEV